MEKKAFGITKEGKEVFTYSITNGKGICATICDYGATIVGLFVPGADGKVYDVSLGYDNVTDYEEGGCFFGATVGRNANRIADAKVTIDGVEYELGANDNENNLHSGANGASGKVWEVKEYKENAITLSYLSKDLEQGFPGDADMEVTYTITDENALDISYRCTSTKKTVMNMTNHCYFNLNGQDSGNVHSQLLQLYASAYTPVKSAKAIPTGEIAPVAGTPFDFTTAKPIGQDIAKEDVQLGYGNGYDHNFVLDRKGDGLEPAAVVKAPESGICMEVWTDCPGIQLYTGNFIEGVKGKGGVVYPKNGAFCLETQYFPNAANEPNFAMPLLDVGEVYTSASVYKFSVSNE